jgi:hypothetical protein
LSLSYIRSLPLAASAADAAFLLPLPSVGHTVRPEAVSPLGETFPPQRLSACDRPSDRQEQPEDRTYIGGGVMTRRRPAPTKFLWPLTKLPIKAGKL